MKLIYQLNYRNVNINYLNNMSQLDLGDGARKPAPAVKESALKNKRRMMAKTMTIAADDPFANIFIRPINAASGIEEETPTEIRAQRVQRMQRKLNKMHAKLVKKKKEDPDTPDYLCR